MTGAANPIESLAAAVHHACLLALTPFEHPEYRFERTPGKQGTRVPTGATRQVRPHPSQVAVTMFKQTWSSTALGFGGIGGQAISEAYTALVEGPQGDVCVYFAGRPAYWVKRPSMLFLEDAGLHRMVGVAESVSRYGAVPATSD